jgi:ATP-binding cassette subfamily F protein uup
MTTLCTLQNLTLTHPHKVIFKNANFTLHEGDKIGVLGLNGHGKSSLFKILMNEVAPDTTVPPFSYDRSKDFSIFMVPQELPLIKDVTIGDYVYEFYPELKKVHAKLTDLYSRMTGTDADIDEQAKLLERADALGEEQILSRYHNLLTAFGLADHSKLLAPLSGGEQRKVALALGLSSPHKIVLWDEPTNHLDLETIQILEEELANSSGTFVLISHDRSLLHNVVDRIVHIERGQIRSFQGTYAQYLDFLQEDQKAQEKALDRLGNTHRRETAWISRGAKARRTKSKKRIEDYQGLGDKIRELKERARRPVSLDLKTTGRKTKILAEGKGVGFTIGGRTLFSGADFSVAKGDKIAIIGANGVGKSTLLKLILGEAQATEGELKRAEGLLVGMFSQKRETLNLEQTPWQLIGEGIDFVISNTGEKRHVASYLEKFLFTSDELKRPIRTFSGGEKNRLQLAHFMKNAQDLWVFDEPTNDLDLETIGVLERELASYQGGLLVVGHDRTFIENVADKCWLLHNGKLEVFEGGPAQAALYLEALELEKELAEMPESLKSSIQAPKEKINAKEKLRYEAIQGEIEKLEKRVEDIRNLLSRFDYSAMDATKTKTVDDLQAALKKSERELDTLVEEWGSLEEKMALS